MNLVVLRILSYHMDLHFARRFVRSVAGGAKDAAARGQLLENPNKRPKTNNQF